MFARATSDTGFCTARDASPARVSGGLGQLSLQSEATAWLALEYLASLPSVTEASVPSLGHARELIVAIGNLFCSSCHLMVQEGGEVHPGHELDRERAFAEFASARWLTLARSAVLL